MRYCPTCFHCFNDGLDFCLYDHSINRDAPGIPLVIDGKYRLEQLIAHGGMGSVFRATHLQLERPIAVKILRAEYLADEKVRERFHREALAAAKLKHPNIISVYDFGTLANGGAYIVMELIEGRSLREEMRLCAARFGQMSPERAATILRQVCAGVEAAHQRGIIHRDLKPDNIMIETAIPGLTGDGEGNERVLVLDFGIAKLKQQEGVVQCLTDEETIIGTPNYISPEQCTGLPVDARSDVYSLGIILYEMLTGRVPFSNQSTSAVLLSHLQEAPAPPARFRAELSPALEQVVLRALAKNPQHRFASAAQMAERLTAVVAGELVAFEPLPEEAATRPRQPRLPRALAAAAAVAPAMDSAQTRGDSLEIIVPADTITVEREPTLLIESRPRRGFNAAFAALLLISLTALGYANRANLQAGYQGIVQALTIIRNERFQTPAQTNAVAPTETAVTAADAPTPNGEGALAAVAPSPAPPEAPEALVKTASTAAGNREQQRAAVKQIYRRWAETALNADWAGHIKLYADETDYYDEGLIARSQVAARKKRILSGLDRYYFKFAGEPRFTLEQSETRTGAQLVFEKEWDLLRGRQRSTGKALTQLGLELQNGEWRIVSEKQLKLLQETTAAVAPKQKAVKTMAVAPKHKAVKTKAAPAKARAAKPAKPPARKAAAKAKTPGKKSKKR
jgi:serine/threonine protein kinase